MLPTIGATGDLWMLGNFSRFLEPIKFSSLVLVFLLSLLLMVALRSMAIDPMAPIVSLFGRFNQSDYCVTPRT
jgi:hypothetical protein